MSPQAWPRIFPTHQQGILPIRLCVLLDQSQGFGRRGTRAPCDLSGALRCAPPRLFEMPRGCAAGVRGRWQIAFRRALGLRADVLLPAAAIGPSLLLSFLSTGSAALECSPDWHAGFA